MYDEPLDELERRQLREEETTAYNQSLQSPDMEGRGPGTIFDPAFQQSGMGTPESGYGPGGVENPAYQNPWTMDMVNQAGAAEANYLGSPTLASPAPPPVNRPAFQPPATPSSYLPPSPAPAQAPPPQTKTPPITDEVTKLLMARLNELRTPGDLNNDPHYQAAIRAYQVAQLRSADRQQKALAERSAAGGTRSTGGFNVGVRGIRERAGENTAQYQSGLAMDRLQQRESQLMEAIKVARAVGQDDLANQLEVQRLALQQELGRGDLALRSELGMGQLGLGYDQLGFNYADLVSKANRDAVLAGLGG